jgi:hypothetical protein
MSGSWSNPGTTLIVITEEVAGFSGLFGYSPSVGTGNLIFSITAAAGTDPYGNAYEPGIISYDNADGVFAQLFEGNLFTGRIADIATIDTGVVGYSFTNLGGGTPVTEVVAPDNQSYTYRSGLFVAPGNGATASTGPAVYLLEGNEAAPAWMRLSGSVLPVSNAGVLVPTVVVGSGGGAPAYNTNWASSTAYGGIASCESLSFQRLSDGMVHVHGAFKTGASAPATNTVFTLPSGFFRTDRVQLFTWHARIVPASNETIGTGSVGTNGAVALSSTNTGSTSPLVANSTFWMDFQVDGPDVQ